MPSDKPVDFDALLRALGAADAEPPPLMNKLLGELRPPSPDGATADAIVIAELEAWLAALRHETPSR